MDKAKIYYVGDKPVKKDTVAGSNAVWRGGFGASRYVPADVAERLCDFPTVWVDEETWTEHYAGEALTPSAPVGLSDVAQLPIVDQSSAPAAPQATSRTTLIQEAIRRLDRTNKDHFGGTGFPKIDAVRDELADDFELDSKEMNDAFKAIKDEFRA